MGLIERIRRSSFVKPILNRIKIFRLNAFAPVVLCVEKQGKTLYLSSTASITNEENIEYGNSVFLYHNTVLDGFNGIKIGDFCQIGLHVAIFTHSSHNSIRLYGDHYFKVPFYEHIGRLRGKVEIGAYTFIGPSTVIMPGTKIGKGCIVAAFSYVSGEFPDYAKIAGNPAKVVGYTTDSDLRNLEKNPELKKYYYLRDELTR